MRGLHLCVGDIGIGYGFNSYYSNLRALESGVDLEYVVLTDADSYRRNKLETHVIEVPLDSVGVIQPGKPLNFGGFMGVQNLDILSGRVPNMSQMNLSTALTTRILRISLMASP